MTVYNAHGLKESSLMSTEVLVRMSMVVKQSPMKNFEIRFSLLELEFRCKNLFLIWEKHWGARI